MHQMPLHLVVMILSRLDDMQTLGSAILSHSLFYTAYKDDPKGIVRSVIQWQIPPCFLRYAAIAYEASHVDRQDKWAVVGLRGWDMRTDSLKKWLVEWEQDPASTSAAVAASMSRTYRMVRHFGHRFLKDTLPLASELYVSPSLAFHTKAREPSLAEKYRIYRALFRFQIYCNLGFRTEQDLQPSPEWAQTFQYARSATMFGEFSPWVNEQLACMHDYLEQTLSKCTYKLSTLVKIRV